MQFKLRRGNLMITFILLIALAAIIASLGFLTVTDIKNIDYTTSRTKSLYIAEAGMQKAIRELSTPIEYGGRGISWRTNGSTESFSGGSYTFRVANAQVSGEVMITAEGTFNGITRKIQARYRVTRILPPPFNYALFWNNSENSSDRLEIGSAFFNDSIFGDCYGNGNFDIKQDSIITSGKVYFPAGYSAIGTGGFLTAEVSNAIPMPTFNNIYYANLLNRYDNLINTVHADTYSPPSTDNIITLEGNSIGFVNINIPKPGSLILYGSGEVIAKTNINVKGNLKIYPSPGKTIALIAKNQFAIEPNEGFNIQLNPGSHIYSKNGELSIIGNSDRTFEAQSALIMTKQNLVQNWPGIKFTNNSIIYFPPSASGKQGKLGEFTFSSSDTFQASIISDCSDTSNYLLINGGKMQGVIYSRICPVRLGNTNIQGALVADKILDTLGQRALLANISWEASFLPAIPPQGLSIEALSFISPSWQEIP